MLGFARLATSSSSSANTTTTGTGSEAEDDDDNLGEVLKSETVLKINSKGQAKERLIDIVVNQQDGASGTFRYFYSAALKRGGNAIPQGTIDLSRANFIRPYDQSDECRVFELQDGSTDKVLIFECPSHQSMKDWLSTIEPIIRKARIMRKLTSSSSSSSDLDQGEASPRISVYEHEGMPQFAKFVKLEMEPLYSSHTSFVQNSAVKKGKSKKSKSRKKKKGGDENENGDEEGEDEEPEPESAVMSCLTVATELANYLDDVISEVQMHVSPQSARSVVDTAAKHNLMLAVCGEVNRVLALLFGPLLEPGSAALQDPLLGDIHALITWLTKYQKRLKATASLFPAPMASTSSSTVFASKTHLLKQVGSTELFARLPALCELYVYGACGDAISGTGAANSLLDYVLKIWRTVSAAPAESLQQHKGGSFHTQAPVDIWRILHQHMSLAALTESQLLHVLVAERVAAALDRLVIEMIASLDVYDSNSLPSPNSSSKGDSSPASPTSNSSPLLHQQQESLQESETEFVCAVANDVALHIENVLELINAFTNGDIRRRLDEAFQSVVVNLVRCGQACLQRLVNLIVQDTREEFEQIGAIHPEWILEGRPVGTITATMQDYLSDLCVFLSPLWTEKFISLLFDTTITQYIASLLNLDALPAAPASSPFGSVYGGSGKGSALRKEAQYFSLPERVARVDKDTQLFSQIFGKFLSPSQARESLDLLREITRMLTMPVKELVQFCSERVSQHPLMAEAVYSTAIACVRFRERGADGNMEREEKTAVQATRSVLQDVLTASMRSSITQAPAATAPIYSRLELRYNDLHALSEGGKKNAPESAFERMQGLASSSLSSLHSAITSRATLFLDRDSRAERESLSFPDSGGRRDSIGSTSGSSGSQKADKGKTSSSSPSRLLSKQTLTPSSASANFVQDVLEALYISESQDEEPLEDWAANFASGVNSTAAPTQAAPKQSLVNLDATVLYRPLGAGLGVLVDAPLPVALQRRYAKITTRRSEGGPDESAAPKFIYTLFLYRKLGSSMLESWDASRVTGIRITCSPRALVYCLDEDAVCVASSTTSELAVPVEWEEETEEEREEGLLAALGGLGGMVSFALGSNVEHGFGLAVLLDAQAGGTQTAGDRERELRLRSVDHLVKWVNAMASIAGLSYDPPSRAWSRVARLERSDRIARARATLLQERQEAEALDIIRAAKAAARDRSSSQSSNADITSNESRGRSASASASAVPPGERVGVVNIANPVIAMRLELEERERQRVKKLEEEKERVRLAQEMEARKAAKKKASVRFVEEDEPRPSPKSKRRAPKPPPPVASTTESKSWFTFG